MDNVGAVCGIIVCILFFGALGYRNLFLIASIPSLRGAILIFSLIKERKPVDTRSYNRLSLKELDKNFKLFLCGSSFFALGSLSYSFLLIYAKEFGFQITFVPVLYLVFTAIAAVFSLPFGKLSDKVGRKPILMLSYIFWGLVCWSFIFIQTYWSLILTFVLYGLQKGALEPVQRALAAELSPVEYRASNLGGFQMVVGLCALPSSFFIAGLLWNKMNLFVPFYFSGSLTILSILMLTLVKENKREFS